MNAEIFTYYSKTLRILYQYYRDELAAGNAGAIVDFTNSVILIHSNLNKKNRSDK